MLTLNESSALLRHTIFLSSFDCWGFFTTHLTYILFCLLQDQCRQLYRECYNGFPCCCIDIGRNALGDSLIHCKLPGIDFGISLSLHFLCCAKTFSWMILLTSIVQATMNNLCHREKCLATNAIWYIHISFFKCTFYLLGVSSNLFFYPSGERDVTYLQV